ncbi:hypothetical protein EYV94_11765 [Puteibacter caeruleilacunae]|nr:hypothetical protein EYV94_11765 [Puteibacter caeruleilacunae]
MKLKFLHIPRPKKFEIPPRYHDPAAEEREARERRIRSELGLENDLDGKGYRSSIKGQMRVGSKRLTIASKQRRKSSVRVIIIAVVLTAIAYYLLTN